MREDLKIRQFCNRFQNRFSTASLVSPHRTLHSRTRVALGDASMRRNRGPPLIRKGKAFACRPCCKAPSKSVFFFLFGKRVSGSSAGLSGVRCCEVGNTGGCGWIHRVGRLQITSKMPRDGPPPNHRFDRSPKSAWNRSDFFPVFPRLSHPRISHQARIHEARYYRILSFWFRSGTVDWVETDPFWVVALRCEPLRFLLARRFAES